MHSVMGKTTASSPERHGSEADREVKLAQEHKKRYSNQNRNKYINCNGVSFTERQSQKKVKALRKSYGASFVLLHHAPSSRRDTLNIIKINFTAQQRRQMNHFTLMMEKPAELTT